MEPAQNILKSFEHKRGFSLSEIPVGTKISIHTKNSLYEFTTLGNKSVMAFGGTTETGVRFAKPTRLTVVGSTLGGVIITDWIGESMRMEFRVEEGENAGNIYRTSRVRDVSLEGKNGDWYYSMDWRG
jgi:hypothetical protein